MTSSSETNRTSYTGSGSAGPFNIGFTVSADSAFTVTKVTIATGAQTLLALTTDYTVNTALTQITLVSSISSSYKIVILLKEPITQGVDFLANDTFPSEVNEAGLDKLTRICLQQQEQIDRSLKYPSGSASSGAQLPEPSNGKALLWSSGNLINSTDDFNDIATNAAASATAAASSASSASSSATSATSSASSATTSASAASTSATAAASSASAAATSATAAASSASAASTSASSASTSATSATSSASTATTQATNAATSATNAATSETNAGTSATSAATQASNASASAGSIPSFKYTYKTSTTMGDPSTGNMRLNNATVGSVTAIAVSASSADSGNPDVSDFIATWGASTNTNKGTITLRKSGTPATFATFTITAAATDNSTWLQLTVTHVASNSTLSADDTMFIGFARAGDKGTDGAGSGDFSSNTATSVVGEMILFADTGGKTGKRSALTGGGLLVTNSGVPSVANLTANGIVLANGTGLPTTLAPGTSGNIATSNGTIWTSAAPAGASALVALTTATASASATLDFSSTYITSTYRAYMFVLNDILMATDSVQLRLRYSQDGGSTFLGSAASDYWGTCNYVGNTEINVTGVPSAGGGTSTYTALTPAGTSIGNDTNETINGFIILHNPAGTTQHKYIDSHLTYKDTTSKAVTTVGGGFYTVNTTAVNGIRFYSSSGNITSGTITVYGIL